MLKAREMFDSIQGEGIHAGIPMTFIRLAGCNLRCAWCDTKYAQESDSPESFLISPSAIRRGGHKDWMCITGGEPLLQEDDLTALVINESLQGRKVEIETNGSILPPIWAFSKIDDAPVIASWVVDIKLPSSGNPSDADIIRIWARRMRDSDQIKLVVIDEDDLDEVTEWVHRIRETKATILVSPARRDDCISHEERMQMVAEFCIKNDLRMSLQLHKVIWGNKRGV